MLKTKNSKVQFLQQYNISKLRNSSRSSLLPGIYIRMEINTSCISRIYLYISNNFTVISHFINMLRSVRLARQVVFLLHTKNEPKTDCFLSQVNCGKQREKLISCHFTPKGKSLNLKRYISEMYRLSSFGTKVFRTVTVSIRPEQSLLLSPNQSFSSSNI